MYNPICPDIFKGGRDKSIESIQKTKLSSIVRNHVEGCVNLSSDFSWVLIALAKMYRGEDLHEIIVDKFKQVKDGYNTFYSSPEMLDVKKDNATLFSYFMTLHSACTSYIEKSISQYESFDNKNDIVYHPFGFDIYLSSTVRLAYDYLAFLSKDLEGNHSLIFDYHDRILTNVNENVSNEFISINALRLELYEKIDMLGLAPDYKSMYEASTSLKEFRSILFTLINVDMIKKNNRRGVEELISSISDSGLLDVIYMDERDSGNDRKKPMFPKDIEDMFDEDN